MTIARLAMVGDLQMLLKPPQLLTTATDIWQQVQGQREAWAPWHQQAECAAGDKESVNQTVQLIM